MAFEKFDPSKLPTSGSYGESGAYHAADYLRRLREALDAGEITVSEFAKQGQKAAEHGIKVIQNVAGRGSSAANAVNPALGLIQQTGWQLEQNGKIRPVLPDEYQAKLREELLPKNITDEEREQFTKLIPEDVDLFSDQGQIEREGLRQAIQLSTLGKTQKDSRSQNLKELASFLSNEENRKFGLAQPDIAEEANARGYYTGTGYSDALARERAKLAGDTSALLAAQSLSDREADIQSLAAVLGKRQDYQQAGLDRRFGLDDELRGYNRARDLAELTRPNMGGAGGNTGSLVGSLIGGGIGAFIAGPAGAGAGAGMGGSFGSIYDQWRAR